MFEQQKERKKRPQNPDAPKAPVDGVVKWFNEPKGFGFITHEGKDIFVHYSEVRGNGFKTLHEGQKVQFDLYEGAKGPIAKSVEAI